jgi:hypothetical protein
MESTSIPAGLIVSTESRAPCDPYPRTQDRTAHTGVWTDSWLNYLSLAHKGGLPSGVATVRYRELQVGRLEHRRLKPVPLWQLDLAIKRGAR